MCDDLKDEEYYMRIEECFCERHKDSSRKHKDPCCFVCSLCGIKIKIELSIQTAHRIRCRVSSGC